MARKKWNYGRAAAFRADYARLDAPAHLSIPGFASLAMLGFVPELLLAKENLLASAEDEFRIAINTSQGPVGEFHCVPIGSSSTVSFPEPKSTFQQNGETRYEEEYGQPRSRRDLCDKRRFERGGPEQNGITNHISLGR
jgi:hypothetical protein